MNNPANNLIVNGQISAKMIMIAAHKKAKGLAGQRILLASRGTKWTYADDLKEALRYMWDRAKMMLVKEAA